MPPPSSIYVKTFCVLAKWSEIPTIILFFQRILSSICFHIALFTIFPFVLVAQPTHRFSYSCLLSPFFQRFSFVLVVPPLYHLSWHRHRDSRNPVQNLCLVLLKTSNPLLPHHWNRKTCAVIAPFPLIFAPRPLIAAMSRGSKQAGTQIFPRDYTVQHNKSLEILMKGQTAARTPLSTGVAVSHISDSSKTQRILWTPEIYNYEFHIITCGTSERDRERERNNAREKKN